MKGANRWPPAFALGLTAVLVFLVLPNPLRIPQNNPAAQPDYAPVPGKNDETSNNANFGETDQASSEGIGAGGLDEGGLPDPPPPAESVFAPRNKPCVGGHQTEDPLSPPCVPFFEGDNGGATAQGVTKDSIRIIFYNDLGIEGDMTRPWKLSDEQPDHEADAYGQQTYLVRTVKALFNFYQEAYLTYDRRIELIAVPAASGIGSTSAQRIIDATNIQNEFHPFAVVHFGDNGQPFLTKMASYLVPGFGLNADVQRSTIEEAAPYAWSFFPDQESEAAWSASFICRKLRGRPARFSSDPLIQQKTRKFGLAFPQTSERGPESRQLAAKLQDYLAQECGLKATPDLATTELIVKKYNDPAGGEAGAIMADFFRYGVTTVICYCVPVQNEITVTKMQNAAGALNYYPEWYWDHTSRMFRAIWNELFAQDRQNGFGTTYHWRNLSFKEQYWYRAYLRKASGSIPNTRFGFDIYHLFLNLFQGLQGAGPLLTAKSVERGMFTFNYLDRTHLTAPIGGYGPYNRQAVSSYTFIDTGMGFWWDPTGTPPGEQEPRGCLRAVRSGKRFYAGEWPEGDEDIFANVDDPKSPLYDPCYQDDTKILKASPGDF